MSISSRTSVRVQLLSADPKLTEWLCEDIGCELDGDKQVTSFSGQKLSFDGGAKDGTNPDYSSCDVAVGIVRFVDVVSLQQISELLEKATDGYSVPTQMLIYRNDNEVDFKMSCPYCGQKLWVRDADQDKRGRCPHCGKGFTLPAEEEHVRSVLRLSASIPIHRVTRQDPGSLAAPLRSILELVSAENTLRHLDAENHSKNATMKVKVEE
ncbi:MAG: hypothetical protein PF795_01820 [Kiritimatiellae bacterium]|nr:hypothetical protein [Kiritimatiellia bacterium]